MNKLQAMRDRIVEIAEENGWEVDVESNDGDNFSYEFSKYSPAGQDFNFEAYLWLDNTGHGTNGAPYDMKDVYEDMEACEEMSLELWKSLSEEDWEEYYED